MGTDQLVGGFHKFEFGESSDERRYSLAETSPGSQPSPRPPLPVAAVGGSTPPSGKVTPRQQHLQQQAQHILELQTTLNAAFMKIRELEQQSDPSTHLDYKIFKRKAAATLSVRSEHTILKIHFLYWKLWRHPFGKVTTTSIQSMPALREKQEPLVKNSEGQPLSSLHQQDASLIDFIDRQFNVNKYSNQQMSSRRSSGGINPRLPSSLQHSLRKPIPDEHDVDEQSQDSAHPSLATSLHQHVNINNSLHTQSDLDKQSQNPTLATSLHVQVDNSLLRQTPDRKDNTDQQSQDSAQPSLATSLQPLVFSANSRLSNTMESLRGNQLELSPRTNESITGRQPFPSPPSTGNTNRSLPSPNPLQANIMMSSPEHQSAFCNLRQTEPPRLNNIYSGDPQKGVFRSGSGKQMQEASVAHKETRILDFQRIGDGAHHSGDVSEEQVATVLRCERESNSSPNESLRISEDSPPRASLFPLHKLEQPESHLVANKVHSLETISDTSFTIHSSKNTKVNIIHNEKPSPVGISIKEKTPIADTSQSVKDMLGGNSIELNANFAAHELSDTCSMPTVVGELSQPIAIKAPPPPPFMAAAMRGILDSENCLKDNKEHVVQTRLIHGGHPSNELVADLRMRSTSELTSLLSYYKIPVDASHSDAVVLLAIAMSTFNELQTDVPDEYITPVWSTNTTPASDHLLCGVTEQTIALPL